MTTNAPHLLVIAFIAIVGATYLACGLITLVARRRATQRPHRKSVSRPELAPARREVTS